MKQEWWTIALKDKGAFCDCQLHTTGLGLQVLSDVDSKFDKNKGYTSIDFMGRRSRFPVPRRSTSLHATTTSQINIKEPHITQARPL